MQRKILFLRAVVITGAGTLLATGFALISMNYHYLRVRPQAPRPELGLTFPLYEHGRVVYLTEEENSLKNILFSTLLIGGIIETFLVRAVVKLKKVEAGNS